MIRVTAVETCCPTIARTNDEGFVYLVDRAADLLIRGGENISSVMDAPLPRNPAGKILKRELRKQLLGA
ncbi:MAG: hypothetical protein HY899_03120 [Deltaproteobacteria bacterium]|nr:hypothetical protein [Deltaproteobacteria bacterium]